MAVCRQMWDPVRLSKCLLCARTHTAKGPEEAAMLVLRVLSSSCICTVTLRYMHLSSQCFLYLHSDSTINTETLI